MNAAKRRCHFPLLTKKGLGEVAADTPNARRVDRNKHCFMNRGTETQRKIEKKKKQEENFA
ncbi:MAG: hypothetical protein A3G18_06040 [Rhodospirillales bacterium RIFCSPLOWO2_12_FULL_58_28]|nr:MAG: hypothetical protein A3H92_06045 [Rhodospirillales bacterium RIFCSPLOWO2_02_FULL_58_16]OHC77262.1 MAG: hypothetical protein A3G18_06040 [Rhodospirillales bacterium RIFCSPLOWO2_12_FULL_58_28]